MSSRGDYVLEQERYASEQIENANKEKDTLLKKAKESARKELDSYDKEKRDEIMDKITEMQANTDILDQIAEKKEKDLKEINDQFIKNKQKVIEYLFENVITVKYEVPDVVKGFFEEKFGITD
jgi:vacuolar-type H+-ATPase subunit H